MLFHAGDMHANSCKVSKAVEKDGFIVADQTEIDDDNADHKSEEDQSNAAVKMYDFLVDYFMSRMDGGDVDYCFLFDGDGYAKYNAVMAKELAARVQQHNKSEMPKF